mmetsp:Transcript_20722/g.63436  ORF Transcript_20722/g.63436 Transcript_20722/m.63436 type:complete len:214 (-) Transcript_20722:1367-2008(-)
MMDAATYPICAMSTICTSSSFSTASGLMMPCSRSLRFSSLGLSLRSSSAVSGGEAAARELLALLDGSNPSHLRSPSLPFSPATPLLPADSFAVAGAAAPVAAGTIMATISATFCLGSFDPPLSRAAAMKMSPIIARASARLLRSPMSTEWSRHSLCVTAVIVRSMSSTETCHIASRKTGNESCVARSCVADMPEIGSDVLPSPLLSAISFTMR